ncbi:MAG TPA: hypothetical protein DCW72_08200 [Elusimicrobia bacterium]|nr:MAG: hypothetical protein A2X29_07320 [Elusimicrobia bacterium GWA2_64_40]HAN04366.1 hypothetical protein [Elusimicrobiota bacterium]HAU90187.1 hypothetical protein [Elusimicrobiota bacterium]
MKKLLFGLFAAAIALAGQASAQEAVTSKYKVNFYGFVKTDAVYDSHGVAGNDYMFYVDSDKASARDFRISSKGTRLGFDISDNDRVTGKIETDFQGDDASNAGLRLRHGYLALKADKFEILAGQTWHLTPLELSGTVNEFALGYSGALWMRAPQLRVTYKHSDALTFAAAAVRPTRVLTDNEGTGSGLPQAQAQAQLKLGKAKLTLMGALGQWRKNTGEKGEVKLVDLGYNIPLTSALTLNGQVWAGQNLYDFLGGIGQNQYGTSAVKASGGFANLAVKPAGRFSYNLAYGVDNPVNSCLAAAATAKTKNETLLANASALVYEKVSVTLEAARMVTEYKLTSGMEDFDTMHYQLSMKFPF